MLELTEIKRLHDKAYQANQTTREKAANDLVFYWVTQWDDQLLSDSQLSYRGEFNVLRKAGRKIMSDLRANPVQVDFDPKDEASDDDAEFLDMIYRASDRKNTSLEAYDYAGQDAVVCGFGAYEMTNVYESNRAGDNRQDIERRFIPEANNTAYSDPNAKRLDKSDAGYWSLLTGYSEDAYKELVLDLTGEEIEGVGTSNFKSPEISYVFPWFGEDKIIYVTRFFYKEKVKDKVLTVIDVLGTPMKLLASDVEAAMDEMIDAGYEIVAEKDIMRWKVTLYIASGDRILDVVDVPCEHIPVIPIYGERAIIEGEEWWEGCTRLAKDPQRLRNFQLSYLADIVSRSPRNKPIFYPEQVQGFESMYEENGADNNYPYYLVNRATANNEPLPPGPAGQMPDQSIPPALAASIDLTKDAVSDVAEAGVPQNIADPDLSGKAVIALQNQIDKQSYIYQHNMKFAKRYDGVVFASMASRIYDAPRTITVVTKSGQKKTVEVMQSVMDAETGDVITLNDLTNKEFDVYADIGPSYDTQKEQTRESLQKMIETVPPGDPLRNILILKLLRLTDGVEFDDLREYANKQLILMGIKQPETPEEEQILIQSQQSQGQPDAQTVALLSEAKAREAEGKAAIQNEINDANKLAIDQYKAETDRKKVEIQAFETGVEIQNKNADTQGKVLDNHIKAGQMAAQRMAAAQRLRGVI